MLDELSIGTLVGYVTGALQKVLPFIPNNAIPYINMVLMSIGFSLYLGDPMAGIKMGVASAFMATGAHQAIKISKKVS